MCRSLPPMEKALTASRLAFSVILWYMVMQIFILHLSKCSIKMALVMILMVYKERLQMPVTVSSQNWGMKEKPYYPRLSRILQEQDQERGQPTEQQKQVLKAQER